jgi:hypothetical protein
MSSSGRGRRAFTPVPVSFDVGGNRRQLGFEENAIIKRQPSVAVEVPRRGLNLTFPCHSFANAQMELDGNALPAKQIEQ